MLSGRGYKQCLEPKWRRCGAHAVQISLPPRLEQPADLPRRHLGAAAVRLLRELLQLVEQPSGALADRPVRAVRLVGPAAAHVVP